MFVCRSVLRMQAASWSSQPSHSGLFCCLKCCCVYCLCVQVMEPASAQLAAAIYSLIAALLGRRHDGPLLLWCIYNLSFARWGLEGRFHTSQQAASCPLDVQQVAAPSVHDQCCVQMQ